MRPPEVPHRKCHHGKKSTYAATRMNKKERLNFCRSSLPWNIHLEVQRTLCCCCCCYFVLLSSLPWLNTRSRDVSWRGVTRYFLNYMENFVSLSKVFVFGWSRLHNKNHFIRVFLLGGHAQHTARGPNVACKGFLFGPQSPKFHQFSSFAWKNPVNW